eukprot:Selendium_serpulae@DN6012_c0_g1_i1.p1
MWLIGVTITIVGSFLGALGDILVRLSFTREDKKDEALRRPLIKRPLWLSGMFCSVVLDGVMTIVALNFTSAAIVTPFAGLHIFWNVVLAKHVLKENVIFQHLVGSGLILFGLTLILIFGIHESPEYGLEELLSLYSQTAFVVYAIFCSGALALCLYISCFAKDTAEAGDGRSSMRTTNSHGGVIEMSNSTSTDLGENNETIAVEVTRRSDGARFTIRKKIRNPKVSPGIRRFAISASSGLCAGNTNIMVQNVMKVFSADGYQALLHWEFIIIIIALAALASSQLYFLNYALKLFEAIFVVPMINSVLIGTACIAGLSLDPRSTSKPRIELLLFGAGAIITIWGILVLSRADQKRNAKLLEIAKLQHDIVERGYLDEINLSGDEEGLDSPDWNPGHRGSTVTSNKGSNSRPIPGVIGAHTVPPTDKPRTGFKQALDKAQNTKNKLERSAQRAGQKLSTQNRQRRYQQVAWPGEVTPSSEDSDGEMADDKTMETVQKYRSQAQLEADDSFDPSQPVVVVERSMDGESHIETLPDGTLKVVIGRSHARAKVAVAPHANSDDDVDF